LALPSAPTASASVPGSPPSKSIRTTVALRRSSPCGSSARRSAVFVDSVRMRPNTSARSLDSSAQASASTSKVVRLMCASSWLNPPSCAAVWMYDIVGPRPALTIALLTRSGTLAHASSLMTGRASAL
jgi:hypothetical protein